MSLLYHSVNFHKRILHSCVTTTQMKKQNTVSNPEVPFHLSFQSVLPPSNHQGQLSPDFLLQNWLLIACIVLRINGAYRTCSFLTSERSQTRRSDFECGCWSVLWLNAASTEYQEICHFCPMKSRKVWSEVWSQFLRKSRGEIIKFELCGDSGDEEKWAH